MNNRWMTRLLALLLFMLLSISSGLCYWRYCSAPVMVKHADLIAIVDVGPVRNEKTQTSSHIVWDHKADAKVVRSIKGNAKSVSIIAGCRSAAGPRICLPDIELKSGRYLVFLSNYKELYSSCNADLGFIPIVDGKVKWYAQVSESDKAEFKRELKSLDSVIEDIQELMESSKAQATD